MSIECQQSCEFYAACVSVSQEDPFAHRAAMRQMGGAPELHATPEQIKRAGLTLQNLEGCESEQPGSLKHCEVVEVAARVAIAREARLIK